MIRGASSLMRSSSGRSAGRPDRPADRVAATVRIDGLTKRYPDRELPAVDDRLLNNPREHRMKTVEYWRWMTWNLQGTKMTPTRHHMDEETALSRHPEATRLPGSMQLRSICTTEEDMLQQVNTRPASHSPRI